MKCFSCLREIPDACSPEEAAAVSLSGVDDEAHVCKACWLQIPVAGRIAIMLVARYHDLGGLGIVDFIFAATDLAVSLGAQADDGDDGDQDRLSPSRN